MMMSMILLLYAKVQVEREREKIRLIVPQFLYIVCVYTLLFGLIIQTTISTSMLK